MPKVPREVREYYDRGVEIERLRGAFPSGPLEFARTQELVLRHLDGPGPFDVLDVGGGPGAYAAWLVGLGHHVRLIDPIPLHVEQARRADARIAAEEGEARQLPAADASVDVVLLLGPLYHLTRRADRVRALHEARRVLRPGGILFAAAISRFAALLDVLVRLDRYHEPDVQRTIDAAVADGVFRGGEGGLFTTAYLHRPADLLDEITDAGFTDVELFNVEGPGSLVTDFERRWDDADRRGALLHAARLVETDPDLLGASSHLLGVARSVTRDRPRAAPAS